MPRDPIQDLIREMSQLPAKAADLIGSKTPDASVAEFWGVLAERAKAARRYHLGRCVRAEEAFLKLVPQPTGDQP